MTTNRIINVYGFIVVIILPIDSVPHCLYSVGYKITTTTIIMLVELLSPGAHPTKDNSIELRVQLNLSSIEKTDPITKIFCPFQDSCPSCLGMCKISL